MPSPTSPEHAERMKKMRPILEELGVQSLLPRGKNVLILGLRTAYKGLATPNAGDDPMDKPSRGLILAAGPGAYDKETKHEDGSTSIERLLPGMVVYFAKFEGSEIYVGSRLFFILDEEKVKAIDAKAADVAELVKNTY